MNIFVSLKMGGTENDKNASAIKFVSLNFDKYFL